jgi:hypothetical protein
MQVSGRLKSITSIDYRAHISDATMPMTGHFDIDVHAAFAAHDEPLAAPA